MRQVKGKNTAPELTVRRLLRSMGQTGYRIHRSDILGKPDIAWVGRKLAVFIHGCFWHGHSCPRGTRIPKTRQDYWQNKIQRNQQRDSSCLSGLGSSGWRVLMLWECELRDENAVTEKLKNFVLFNSEVVAPGILEDGEM